MQEMSYISDQQRVLIIANWFRKLDDSNISIGVICNIIVEFAKMYERFDAFDKAGVKITGNGTIALVQKFTHSSYPIYCKRIIPNETQQLFTWKFKCWNIVNKKYWENRV